MLNLKIDLTDGNEALVIQMPNGDEHMCTEDWCDCDGSRYGNLCRHRLFIFAMGGFDSLKKTILSERRKAKLNQPASTASDTKGTETQ